MIPIYVVLYKNPEIERRCLEHLDRHYPDEQEYPRVIVDNGERNENLGALWNRMIEEMAPAAWYEELDPVGLLLNTDCFLLDDQTLPMLQEPFRFGKRVGFTGPMTDHCGSEQCIGHPMWKREWSAERYAGQILVGRYISGFCFMFRLRAFRAAGRFPEDGPFYGQESALLYKAFRAGWQTVVRLDAFVEHLGGASIKAAEDRGEMDQDAEREKSGAWFRDFRQSAGEGA